MGSKDQTEKKTPTRERTENSGPAWMFLAFLAALLEGAVLTASRVKLGVKFGG
jgi:hypothetical protein